MLDKHVSMHPMIAKRRTTLIRYYIILLIKGTLIYRTAQDIHQAFKLMEYDSDLPDVVPLGFCDSFNWAMEWQVSDELREKFSGVVLELINYIRRISPE